VADLFMMFNAGNEAVTFVVPQACPARIWRLATDTAEPSSPGFYSMEKEAAVTNSASYLVQSRSSAILVAR
jgi:glycogen operon protein